MPCRGHFVGKKGKEGIAACDDVIERLRLQSGFRILEIDKLYLFLFTKKGTDMIDESGG